MPICYRCRHCGTLLSISRKKIGQSVPCPTCDQPGIVPEQDEFDFESASDAGREQPADEEVLFDEFPAEQAQEEPVADSEIEFAAAVGDELIVDESVIDEPVVDEPVANELVIAQTEDAEPHAEPHTEPVAISTAADDVAAVQDADRLDAAVVAEPERELAARAGERGADDEPYREQPPIEEPHSEETVDQESDGETALVSEGEDSGFTVRRRQIDTEEMDLTPMVDMTFLLLIFFMITASFQLQKSIEVPSPSPEQSGASQALMPADELEQTTIRIQIDEKSAVFIEDQPVPSLAHLTEQLQTVMRTTQRWEVLLSASPAAYHETIVAVVDAAQGAGVQKIRMAASGGDDS